MKAKISYLNHSGFILETAKFVAVFDLYTDPAGVLASYENSGKPTVFFVSHSHFDHWNSGILGFQNSAESLYILERSCQAEAEDRLSPDDQRRIIYVEPYDALDAETLAVPGLRAVYTFGSTDEGVSFLLQTEAGNFFHAGDLNDWDWQDEDSEAVELSYRTELEKMSDQLGGEDLVLAFVPVDERLGETAFNGSRIFLEYSRPHYLVPMHLNGGNHLPGELRQELHSSQAYEGTHVVTMTIPGMPFEIA